MWFEADAEWTAPAAGENARPANFFAVIAGPSGAHNWPPKEELYRRYAGDEVLHRLRKVGEADQARPGCDDCRDCAEKGEPGEVTVREVGHPEDAGDEGGKRGDEYGGRMKRK